MVQAILAHPIVQICASSVTANSVVANSVIANIIDVNDLSDQTTAIDVGVDASLIGEV